MSTAKNQEKNPKMKQQHMNPCVTAVVVGGRDGIHEPRAGFFKKRR